MTPACRWCSLWNTSREQGPESSVVDGKQCISFRRWGKGRLRRAENKRFVLSSRVLAKKAQTPVCLFVWVGFLHRLPLSSLAQAPQGARHALVHFRWENVWPRRKGEQVICEVALCKLYQGSHGQAYQVSILCDGFASCEPRGPCRATLLFFAGLESPQCLPQDAGYGCHSLDRRGGMGEDVDVSAKLRSFLHRLHCPTLSGQEYSW